MTTPLAIYLAVCAVVLIAPLVGLYPPVHWNGKASRNSIRRIEMLPASYYADTGQSMRGVYAQERVEHWLDWFLRVAFSGIVALPMFLLIDHLFAAILSGFALILGTALTNQRWWKLQTELIGHTVETVVATKDGFELDAYLKAEAARTFRSSAYDGLFMHLTLPEFEKAMRRRIGLARFLAALQAIPLRKMPVV